MSWSWIITGVLVLFLARIVYLEVICGRKSKEFLRNANEQIHDLRRRATESYRAKFGRDPTAPFIKLDDSEANKS